MLWLGKPGPRATGFMAGRRVGGSVVRNRARRRLREAFRQEQHRLPAVGVRMGFVARRGCIGQAYPLLRAGMASALIGILLYGGGTLASALMGAFPTPATSMPLTGLMAACGILGVSTYLLFRPHAKG